MNEQIKALMGQTLDEKFAGTWSTMDIQDLQKFAERFAELIVRECAEFANNHNEEVEGVTLGVGQALKKHFGVKE
jgi:hypothetical protein